MEDVAEIFALLRSKLGSDDAVTAYILRVAAGESQRGDLPRLRIRETVTLAKFDGEYDPTKKPVETITLEDQCR